MSDSALWPAGVGHIALTSVDSTNAEAFRRAPTLDCPTWITATAQSAGRGRRAQPWSSPPGNLYATLILPLAEAPQTVALRSFIAALALRAALDHTGGSLSLKWPNDVLLNGGKVAGILLEAQPHQGTTLLAIGIGVNLIHHPAPAPQASATPVSVLSQTGLRVAPDQLLARLAAEYARYEAMFRAQGFAPIRSAWLAHAARLGQPIRARTGSQTRDGIFQSIDVHGNLILAMPGGPLSIPAAEVFFD